MKKNRFNIDFFEFSFLVEACIPPLPIARTVFWYDVIDKYYHVLTKNERARLFEWINRNGQFEASLKKEEDSRVFYARYDPNNQYLVTAKGEEIECFLFKERYYTKRNTWIAEEYIEKVEKI